MAQVTKVCAKQWYDKNIKLKKAHRTAWVVFVALIVLMLLWARPSVDNSRMPVIKSVPVEVVERKEVLVSDLEQAKSDTRAAAKQASDEALKEAEALFGTK